MAKELLKRKNIICRPFFEKVTNPASPLLNTFEIKIFRGMGRLLK
jgi:hypothetical protein